MAKTRVCSRYGTFFTKFESASSSQIAPIFVYFPGKVNIDWGNLRGRCRFKLCKKSNKTRTDSRNLLQIHLLAFMVPPKKTIVNLCCIKKRESSQNFLHNARLKRHRCNYLWFFVSMGQLSQSKLLTRASSSSRASHQDFCPQFLSLHYYFTPDVVQRYKKSFF